MASFSPCSLILAVPATVNTNLLAGVQVRASSLDLFRSHVKPTNSEQGWLLLPMYLILIILIWCVASVHLGLSIQRMLRVDSGKPVLRLKDGTEWGTAAHISLVATVIWLGDILVVYRTFIVWNRLWIVAVPLVLDSVKIVVVLILGYVARIVVETTMLYPVELLITIILNTLNHPVTDMVIICMVPSISIIFVLMAWGVKKRHHEQFPGLDQELSDIKLHRTASASTARRLDLAFRIPNNKSP
ncbi:hypothetical protein BJ165DRAFT_1399836 [Panaeolus papilionaceus]|nr:hypothetical protein BJ165DRAFT_1399836 [Panaeolus papilionaceus]